MSLVLALSTAVAAEPQVVDLFGDGNDGNAAAEPRVVATLRPAKAKPLEKLGPGDRLTLAVTLQVPEGSYTYSMNPDFGGRTRIVVEEPDGLQAVDESFTPDKKPKASYEKLLEQTVEKHVGTVTWTRTYRIKANADVKQLSVAGTLHGQVCNDRSCRPIRKAFRAALGEAPSPSPDVSGKRRYRYTVQPERRKGNPEPIEFEFALAPEDAEPGDEVTLSITARPEEGFHIFALTQDPSMAGLPTVIKLGSHAGLEPMGKDFAPAEKYEVYKPEASPDIVQRVHHGEITWTRRFRVKESASEGRYAVAGSVRYQICNKGQCRPPMTVQYALGTSQPVQAAVEDDLKDRGLIAFLVTAVLAGFAALLTPCVFPMIPITVSFFLKQSEQEHHRPTAMASIYSLGIIATFTLLGLLMAALFGATSINKLANNPWLNLGIAGVLVFFGLNLLGLFEIRVPSGLLTWSSGRQAQGGIVGVLFMALTFTLVSFTCTFAFAGALLVWAAKGEYYWPVLGMVAFSAAFSLPFFFLALFPSYLQKLPKSGGWMNRVKVTMGMIEMGAAFKFLSVADLTWNPLPRVFNYTVVMSVWVILAAVTGLYLLGVLRRWKIGSPAIPKNRAAESDLQPSTPASASSRGASADAPRQRVSPVQLGFALAFLGLAGYLGVGLFAPKKLSGKVWEQIAAFAPPSFEGGMGEIGPYLKHGELRYALDFDQARQVAAEKNQPLFLDFTGVNCVNCRLMEDRMEKPQNAEKLKKFVRVQLYTDNVPFIRNRQFVDQLLENNRSLQQDWFGDVTLPSYAVVTPDGETVLATFKGLEQREGEFAEFLSSGFAKWKDVTSAGPEPAAGIARRNRETTTTR